MSASQPSPIPPAGQRPRLHDLRWLGIYGLRGLAELVRARLVFARLQAQDVPRRNRAARDRARTDAAAEPAHLARIAYVLPRLSARLPWRSDCLVQAIAGQNWLAAEGLASEIQIGVQRSQESGFGAHAWLVHDGRLICGGDITPYEPLLAETALVDAADVSISALVQPTATDGQTCPARAPE